MLYTLYSINTLIYKYIYYIIKTLFLLFFERDQSLGKTLFLLLNNHYYQNIFFNLFKSLIKIKNENDLSLKKNQENQNHDIYLHFHFLQRNLTSKSSSMLLPFS